MSDESKRRSLVEGMVKLKLQQDGDEVARNYVEMPEVPLPEEEVESGASKAKIQERMKKLAAMGAIGMGTSAVGAGLRDVGMALSTAKSQMGDGKIDVKSIAKRADNRLSQRVPRETARYLRASSEEWSPASPAQRKTPASTESGSVVRSQYGRSGSVSSVGSQSSLPNSPSWSKTARAAVGANSIDSSSSDSKKDTAPSEIKKEPLSASSRGTSPVTKEWDAPKSPVSANGPKPPSPTTKSDAPLSPSMMRPYASVVVGGSSIAKQKSEETGSSKATSTVLNKQKSEEGTSSSIKSSPFLTKQQMSKPDDKVKSKTSHGPSKVATSPIAKGSATTQPASPVMPEPIDTDPNRKYTLDELQKSTPAEVKAGKKEDFLKLAEFRKAFNVDPETFAKYPEWKKLELRKQAKIF